MHTSLFALALGIFAHFSSAIPQQSFSAPQPATTGPSTTCGACYGVADVLGVVFGDVVEVVVTQTVATSTGRNGSTVTLTLPETETVTTSIPVTTGKFTFVSSGIISPGPTAPAVTGGSGGTFTIGTLTLVSPTTYNIISAYSVTSTIPVDGSCSVSNGLPAVTSAFAYTIDSGGPLIAQSAEASFFNAIGLTCSGGGANPTSITVTPVTTVTVQSTTTATATSLPSPLPETSGSNSAAASTTTSSASLSSASAATTITASSTITTSVAASTFTATTVTPTTLSSPVTTGTVTSPVTTTVSIGTTVVIGNTTYPYPTGTGGGPIITPYPGPGNAAPSWNRELSQSWLFWGSGLLAMLFSMLVL